MYKRQEQQRTGEGGETGAPAAAQEVGGAGVDGARVELGAAQERPDVGSGRRLDPFGGAEGGGGVRRARRGEEPGGRVGGESFEDPQGERGPRFGGGLGQGPVEREFVGSPGPGEEPQAEHQGQWGRGREAARRTERGADDGRPQPRVRGALAGALPGQGGPGGRCLGPVRPGPVRPGLVRPGPVCLGPGCPGLVRPGFRPTGRLRQGVLHEGVGGEDAAVAAERGRQDEVGEPYERGVVLDERGLGGLAGGAVGGYRGAGKGVTGGHARQTSPAVPASLRVRGGSTPPVRRGTARRWTRERARERDHRPQVPVVPHVSALRTYRVARAWGPIPFGPARGRSRRGPRARDARAGAYLGMRTVSTM